LIEILHKIEVVIFCGDFFIDTDKKYSIIIVMNKMKWILDIVTFIVMLVMTYLLVLSSSKIQNQQQLLEENSKKLVSLENQINNHKDTVDFFEELMFFLDERVKVLEASIFDNNKTA